VRNPHSSPEEMMRDVADNVKGLCVSNAAHSNAGENPEAFTTGLLRFLTNAETNESSCSHVSHRSVPGYAGLGG
jgi:hypothetical protein